MPQPSAARWKSIFGIASLILWLGILFATLSPFQFRPHNDVTWLDGGGLLFGRHGVVISSAALTPETSNDDSECSLEILLKPASYTVSSPILTFSAKDHPWEMDLRQYRDGLILRRERPPDSRGASHLKRDAVHVFKQPNQPTLVTITSGPKGTAVYSDGQLLERFPNFSLSRKAMTGTLTIGTDPVHIDTWSGDFRGLAFYTEELSPAQVSGHYQAWTQSSPEQWNQTVGVLASRFAFRGGQGTHIKNLAGGADLIVPPIFYLPLKAFLTPPWKEFSPTRDYVDDALRNIIGFVPFGFALCGYLFLRGETHHPILFAVLLGGLTSLFVETAQGFLPQRDSSLTDVTTNTFGMLIGAYLFHWNPIRKYFTK
jgi:VanZ family protein